MTAVEEDTMTAGEIIRALNLHRAMNGQEPITKHEAFPGLAAATAMTAATQTPTELTAEQIQPEPQQHRAEPHAVYDQPVTPDTGAGDMYRAQLSPERLAAGDAEAHKSANIRKLEAQVEGASVTPIPAQNNR